MTNTQVSGELVSFVDDGAELRGELFLSASGDEPGGLPGVVVTGNPDERLPADGRPLRP